MINTPRVTLAAVKGGAGKTFISIGLISALNMLGHKIAAFKKGPDYIDAGWLGLASGSACRNLDSYLFEPDVLLNSFYNGSKHKDLAIIEGNRGIYDGVDSNGSYSTAELAKFLKSPLVLILDVTKTTRTAAAVALGCKALDPDLDLRGIILNRVAGARHERVVREAVADATGLPVIGAVGKLPSGNLPQRHLGLLPLHEHPAAAEFVAGAGKIIADAVDLDAILRIASRASELKVPPSNFSRSDRISNFAVKIGVLKDSAFQFYYPENLEALESRGATIIPISALSSASLPDLDALYIGGGFPETHVIQLAENSRFRDAVFKAAQSHLPIYAECGGLMFLSRNLVIDGTAYPMSGVFPVDTILDRKPRGLGYIEVETIAENPFYPIGSLIKGHEFHYSFVPMEDTSALKYAFRVTKGQGLDGLREGLTRWNVLATYLHIHALGEPLWAQALLRRADEFKKFKAGSGPPKSK